MTELGHHGQHAAHGLGQQHCYQQRQCHSQSNHFIAGVSDDQTHKIHRAEDYAHQEADTQFLPEHFYKVPQLNFSHSHAANHQGTALAAGIAAGIGEHGDKGHQQRHGCKGRLVPAQDPAGDHAGDHQHQQPHNPVLGQGKHTGLEVGLLRGGHSGHLLKVFGGLLFHNVHYIVNGDDAHQPLFFIHHRQGDEVVLHHSGHRFFLILCGLGGNHICLHQIRYQLIIPGQQQLPDRHHALQLPAGIGNVTGINAL